MHAENIELLFFVPLVLIALGIFYLILGLRTQLNTGHFRRAFTLYGLGCFTTVFVRMIVNDNGLGYLIESDSDTVYYYSTIVLASCAGLGFVYFYFNNFVPMLFIRVSLLASMFSLILGVYVAMQKIQDGPGDKPTGGFNEVKQQEPSSTGGGPDPDGPKRR